MSQVAHTQVKNKSLENF